jgi:tetratricopeptide (TPR) repeat protein
LPRTVLAALAWVVVISSPGQAGIYELASPAPGPVAAKGSVKPLPFPIFRDRVTDIRMEQPNSKTRNDLLKLRTDLDRKRRSGAITVDEQINLNAVLIRLREYDAAIDVLTPVAIRERGNYAVYANLITAHQLNGQLNRAFGYLIQIKGGRPREWPGANREQLDWFVRADSFHWKLIDLRYRESLKQPAGPGKEPRSVDDLFGIEFVGETGQYEAGKLAAAQRDKLPPDALAIVQQLLLWLPDDNRLYWLYGELLNAAGDLDNAMAVFDENRGPRRRFDPEELRAHRQIIQEALAAQGAATADGTSWLPSRNHLIIGGGLAGLVIVFLAYLQYREFRRRRQGKPFVSKGA